MSWYLALFLSKFQSDVNPWRDRQQDGAPGEGVLSFLAVHVQLPVHDQKILVLET